MYRDEVIEEVWRIRDEYVKRHHHNLDEIVEDLRRREAEHPSRIVDRRRQQPNQNPSKRTMPSGQ